MQNPHSFVHVQLLGARSADPSSTYRSNLRNSLFLHLNLPTLQFLILCLYQPLIPSLFFTRTGRSCVCEQQRGKERPSRHKALGEFHLTACGPVSSCTRGESDADTPADAPPPAGLDTSNARVFPELPCAPRLHRGQPGVR